MQDLQAHAKERYLRQVLAAFPPPEEVQLLVIAHCLADKPPFLRTLGSAYRITRLVPVPYSVDHRTTDTLARTIPITHLPMETLLDHEQLLDFTSRVLDEDDRPLAVLEVGGYHAPLGEELRRRHGDRFLGCVEVTENGHRAYEAQEQLAFPVVSVARSRLKAVEGRLTGSSVVFSVERFVRELGQPMVGLTVGILGYGRIGSSVSRAAAGRAARVMAYDSCAFARVEATADGFSSPSRGRLLRVSDVVVGCTGRTSLTQQDIGFLRDGAVLASAGSKQHEFDVAALRDTAAQQVDVGEGVQRFDLVDGRSVFLLAGGYPVNFTDRAVLGPVLALVQAELLCALRTLAVRREDRGILTVAEEDQGLICRLWADHFLDRELNGTVAVQDPVLADLVENGTR